MSMTSIFCNLVKDGRQVLFDVTFPKAKDEPARLCERVVRLAVALDVAGELLAPVFRVRCDLLAIRLNKEARCHSHAADESSPSKIGRAAVLLAAQAAKKETQEGGEAKAARDTVNGTQDEKIPSCHYASPSKQRFS